MFMGIFVLSMATAMYQALLFYHNLARWLVLASLAAALFRACKGLVSNATFSRTDNALRHWTATLAHLQLMIGMVLYFQSPAIRYFRTNFADAVKHSDAAFFGLIHSSLMLTAIVVVTIGSAMAKRKQIDREKFRTMVVWYAVALLLIFIAIPWPFSPFANRPYFR
jgi:hypothetical protein